MTLLNGKEQNPFISGACVGTYHKMAQWEKNISFQINFIAVSALGTFMQIFYYLNEFRHMI